MGEKFGAFPPGALVSVIKLLDIYAVPHHLQLRDAFQQYRASLLFVQCSEKQEGWSIAKTVMTNAPVILVLTIKTGGCYDMNNNVNTCRL